MPNRKTMVRTNQTPNSIKEVPLMAVSFQELWNNYPSGDPYNNPDYPDQCAIRMSVTFHRVGIEMKSFSQKLIKPAAGKESIGRIILDGKATATRADELADWLKHQPFAGCPKPENITGPDWESKVKGRTGIIAFKNYWARSMSETNPTGGHIDLWNGTRLTISSSEGLLGVIGRGIGISSAHFPGTTIGYSDLSKATEILFWEIK
jgi:hypothetical protein